MTEYETSLIDTNILVYVFDASEKEKHKIAKKILRKCWNNEENYAVSLQNLSEFFVNVTKKVTKPIPKEKASHIVKSIIDFAGFEKFFPTVETIKKALDLCCNKNINYWDALLIATMQDNSINHVYTENIKDFQIEGIHPINPF